MIIFCIYLKCYFYLLASKIVESLGDYLIEKYPPNLDDAATVQAFEDILELSHIAPFTGRKKIYWTMRFEDYFGKKFYNKHLLKLYLLVCLICYLETIKEKITLSIKDFIITTQLRSEVA